MALSVISSGTQAAVIGTEHSLATSTVAGAFAFIVDMVNLVNGDTVELRVYTKSLSGSTKQLAYYAVYSHVQATPNKYSVPVPSPHYVEVSLKQTAGTGRNFPWELVRLDA